MLKALFAFLAIFGAVFATIWNLKQIIVFVKENWLGICVILFSIISTFVIIYTA